MYSLNPFNISGIGNNTSFNRQLIPVRVTKVILTQSDVEAERYNGTKALGAIKFKYLGVEDINEDAQKDLVAYPGNPSIKQYPLVNEIVFIYTGPDFKITTDSDTSSDFYYTTPVNIWNNSNHNAAPKKGSKGDKLGGVKDVDKVNSLQPYPGDLTIEGRLGQSIRFTGNKGELNPYTDDSNDADPLTILTNGQGSGNKNQPYTEDINKDPSSIYLTSNHSIPLKQVRDKNEAWKSKPVKADKYKGSQVVINAGRLYFNSKDESTLFSSKEAFGVTSNTINLDAKEYIGLDAKKIYLGEKALKEEFEPVILGESMEGFLYTLLFNLQSLADDLIVAGTAGVNVQNLITRGKVMKASLKGLQAQINPGGKSQLKSRKVYTE